MKKKLLKLISSKLLLAVGGCLALANTASAQVSPVVEVKDSIVGARTFAHDTIYLLKGFVYAVNNSVLTIEPGTIIKGDKNSKGSLIIEKGAKIMAQGTADHPIVFTSNQAVNNRSYGDWGGLILCGKAPANWIAGSAQVEGGPRSMYGGVDPHDNSGVLSYIRIEFAGVAFSPNNEVNGLSLYGIGDGTQIDHIQISYSGDDGIEWFGGTVNSKYLVSYKTWDDDFDTDLGYSGKNQYVVVLRDPYAADQSGSKAFESDSYQSGTNNGKSDTTHLTNCVFANVTAVGPLVSPTSTAFDPQYVAGVQIRRGSSLSLLNSLVLGWPAGILIDESSSSYAQTTLNIRDSIMQIAGVTIAGIPTNGTPSRKDVMYVIDGARNLTSTAAYGDTTTNNPFAPYSGPYSWMYHASHKNRVGATVQNAVKLSNPFNLDNPSFVPTSSSPICYNSKTLPSYMTNLSHFPTADPFSNGKVYPFNPALPINTDTTNWFANYNAPSWVPVKNYKLDNFFDVVNYVGAFAGTQTTTDDWTDKWCNFDPISTDYSKAYDVAVNEVATPTVGVFLYPNPTRENSTMIVNLENDMMLSSNLYDASGKLVYAIENQQLSAGTHYIMINTSNLSEGIYYIQTVGGDAVTTTKLVVNK
jgi:hypothetical protein